MIRAANTPTSAAMIPAVSYIRMSSDQQEASPEQQREENAKLAAKYGCRIIREYYDEAISGAETRKRKDFQRMIADATTIGDFKVILCWDQDRFGRFDSIDAGEWIAPLRRASVKLVTKAQGEINWEDFAGRLVYQVTQEGKHQFLRDLARNVTRGRTKAAAKGLWICRVPYGYCRSVHDETGALVKVLDRNARFTRPKTWSTKLVLSTHAHEIETVRWMFRTFAETETSLRAIALELNRRGLASPDGAHGWRGSSVALILRNNAYIGTLDFGFRKCGKFHRAEETVTVENAHDPLIDVELFNRVQNKLAERKFDNRKPRDSWTVLTGLIFCGHCGRVLCGTGRANRHYYVCSGGTGYGKCRTYRVRAGFIEEEVARLVSEKALRGENLNRLRAALTKQFQAKATKPKNDAKELRRRIVQLDRQIMRGTENLLLAHPADVQAARGILAAWRADRQRLQAAIRDDRVPTNSTCVADKVEAAVRQLENLAGQLTSAHAATARAAFRKAIERIDLWWEPNGKRFYRLVRGKVRFKTDAPPVNYLARSP